jgi:outer membrane protein assembly factor BamD
MNRLTTKIAAVALAVLLLGGVAAQAKGRKPKQKKQDLSANPLLGVKSKQPDKELFDKAMIAIKKGRFDVARLDLQTMLNTYPDSEYRMRAKLAVGDSWFKEGGTAALTQAEAEYKDFITFFPQAPEAAEAQMKVADIYYEQMEKPDRDFTNAQRAEQEYRAMINSCSLSRSWCLARRRNCATCRRFWPSVKRRSAFITGPGRTFAASIARLKTVVDTYPLYSKSDQALLGIGDAYAGQAHAVQIAPNLPGAIRERMRAVYQDRAAEAYTKVITRYPMAPHVEDARDRLVAMNRPVPEPTQEAVAENDAEERSRQPLRFNDKFFGIIKHGPQVVEAVHVGDPSLEDPKRTLAPDVTKQNIALFNDAIRAGQPAAPAGAITPTGVNEPPRSDQPSQAPLQLEKPAGGTGVGVQVVSAPDAVLKPVGPDKTVAPPAEKPAEAPGQVNDIKSGSTPAQAAGARRRSLKPI